MRRHPIPVVAGCIIKQHPLRILLHRKDEAKDEHGVLRNPELLGLWEFPGGIIEGSESPEIALEREIGEELGIIVTVRDIVDAKTVTFKDKKPYLILFYLCQTNYEPTPDKCCYFRAVDIPAISKQIIPGDLPIINELIRRYE
jgi:8-oxo-dGTP diphosphatase